MDTTLTVKIPKKVKDDAKRIADELGIPLTTVVNSMLRKFAHDKEVTFSVYPTLKPEKAAELDRISDEMDKHPERSLVFESAEDLIAHMDKVWVKGKKRIKKLR